MRAPALLAILASAVLVLLAGCPGQSLGTCSNQPDVSGNWTFTLDPTDGGAPTIPSIMTIQAQLTQVKSANALGLGAQLWGTLTSSDKGAFDVLTIPQLMHNNGSKTGAILGCELKINVPIAMPVTDDDSDQGPLRLALTGQIVALGMIEGELSTLIRGDDTKKLQRSFVWAGVQR